MTVLRFVCCFVMGAMSASVLLGSMHIYGGHVVVGVLLWVSFIGYVVARTFDDARKS